ncbi:MAG: S8 family serine peptidase [Clostridium sp.]|nr:S8 family serine peptidase [Clostridium sp.]
MRKKRKGAFTEIGIFLLLILVIALITLWTKDTSSPVNHRLQWWLSAINWDEKRTNETGEGIKIAVLDSGIDASHPDLRDVVLEEYRVPGVMKNGTGDILHGTAVAGIIAGNPSHDKGILGVAVHAKILSVDVTDAENGTMKVKDLIDGIRYAISQNVDIINISAGVKENSVQLHEVIKEAYGKGIVIVAAAGNFMNEDLLYPAKYPEVIATGALSKDGEVSSPTGSLPKNVVYLPGENIVTAKDEAGYTGIDGTSASTPILSGVIALMMEKHKNITNEEIIKYFRSRTFTGINVKDVLDLK